MNNFKFISAIIILVNLLSFQNVMAQDFTVTSPDQNIKIKIINGEQLTWSCTFLNRMITESSALGFEFKNEPAMTGNFNVR